MSDYLIPREASHAIAVGLYQRVGEYVAANRNTPDYKRFEAEYLSRQAAQAPAPTKRRYTRKNRTASR